METQQKQIVLSLLRSGDQIKTPKHLKSLHANFLKTSLHQSNFAVGNFIARCSALGLMRYANNLFDGMHQPNSFVYNTMIRGFQQNQQPAKALLVFNQMMSQNVQTDHFTYPFVIKACADLNDVIKGKSIHGSALKTGLVFDVFVGTSLIEFYCSFGDIKVGRCIFEEMSMKDQVAWTVLLSAYVNHCGDMERASELFKKMPVKDIVACNTMISGYVKVGDIGLAKMVFDQASVRDLLMYNTMLGGYTKNCTVETFVQFFHEMPERDLVSWNSLIGGFVHNKRINEAMACFHRMKVENVCPNDVTLAIILSACAQAGALDAGRWLHSFIDRNKLSLNVLVGRWDDVAKVRELMGEKKIGKLRGCSSIEINGEVHEFGVEEKVHPRAKEICNMINEVSKRLSMEGHVASTNEVFFDVEEEEKEKALVFHSEKMAVAFGLIATKPGSTIRIVKNLRICADCHGAIKLISRIYEREIVVRDRSRFHHFKEGSCSCGDYW
ncbi:Pentatricopeptide repeat [Dillenia turbinata]|uniref:Pentatricopeptide repeat n=1 Tax=Dillenia turbinata TaxID=194707 RepID=A0AAN8VU74_9MAGN